MNFEGGSPKSKGIARNRKYVNLADVIRKIDYVTRSCGSSSQMRKEINDILYNLKYFTEEDFKIETKGE